jgi:ketosteroid isomerase-like protein
MKQTLGPEEVALIQQAVRDCLVDYWFNVDREGASRALEYYTEDCVYQMCEHRMEGHAPIQAYYGYRASRGARLVRHIVSNLRVRVHAREHAELDGILCVYAADGVAVLPMKPPNMVADIHGEFVRGADGAWRMRQHRLIPLFQGSEGVLTPPA